MPANRLLLRAASAALLALALVAPGVAASTKVEVERASGINLDTLAFGVTAACGFTVELHSVGRVVIISRYDDGRLVSQTVQIVYHGYLLNPANGKTVTSKVAGPEHTTYLDDGTIVFSATGSTVRTVPGGGLVSGFIGRDYVELAPTGELDGDGLPIYEVVDESSSGRWLGNGGVCEYLA
ncbi:MAG: hypothetical protein A2V85_07850 [Chloroflexi bacterium RBG_16_72_14]|nr:MAG: hypothetical protein A2V85_07850 [Chloroflexi bacterium RBG_16_72_14]